MSTLRALLGIVGGGAFGVIIALAITHLLTPLTFGVCTATLSACVIGIYLIRAIQEDRARMRCGRDAVWQRRSQAIVRDAIDQNAVDLLKTDPDEYFRQRPPSRWREPFSERTIR